MQHLNDTLLFLDQSTDLGKIIKSSYKVLSDRDIYIPTVFTYILAPFVVPQNSCNTIKLNPLESKQLECKFRTELNWGYFLFFAWFMFLYLIVSVSQPFIVKGAPTKKSEV